MMDDETAVELRDGIHNLLRRVSICRLNAMLEDREDRIATMADLLDEVERELSRLENL